MLTTLARRTASNNTLSKRSSILANFLLREAPQSLSSSPEPPLPFPSDVQNPFLPHKRNPLQNSLSPPKYSIRRQKLLRKQVHQLGLSDDILPKSLVQVRREAVVSPTTTAAAAAAGGLVQASPHIQNYSTINEALLPKKGPYLGRKGAAFKGKTWERNWTKRQEELEKALEGQADKIRAWRKATKDEKSKKIPAPF
ncbi:hypothetical protein T439DRAFT_314272 [Meredithblackwellia eburnea MCA 4105]